MRSFRQILIVLLLRIYISSLLQKFHFAIEAVLDSLQTQRGTGTSFYRNLGRSFYRNF